LLLIAQWLYTKLGGKNTQKSIETPREFRGLLCYFLGGLLQREGHFFVALLQPA
jgi:hypothetical protein